MTAHPMAANFSADWRDAVISLERALLLLQDRAKPAAAKPNPKSRIQQPVDFSRIRCPLCAWRPTAAHRWFCAPCDYPEFFTEGCGACWNTFSTRGRCPGCSHQWRWTACLNCAEWSLHEDWYENSTPESH